MWPPVSLAEVRLPTRFEDDSDDTDIDLVVVGESSAAGVPYGDWLSIGRLVAWKLEEAIPGRKVRLQVLAASASILEHQHLRLADLKRRPDLLIVYCGHNEFSSRLNGARDLPYYVDDREPGGWRRVCEHVEAISPLCEMIRQSLEKCRLEVPPTPSGNRELVDRPAYTADEYDLLLADFRRRLEAIARWGSEIGATIVLIPPPGDEAGYEPNRSFLPAATTRPVREAFGSAFLAARELEPKDPEAAIAAYRTLVDRQPGFAEAHYRLGVLLDAAGDEEGSYRHFAAARDGDGYPMRCLGAFLQIYHEAAARHGAILLDARAELHAIGSRGRLDDELFQDAMHPSMRGQLALAQAVLREVRNRHAFGWPDRTPAPALDPKTCADWGGLDSEAWKKICLWGVHFGNYSRWLRFDPTVRVERTARYAIAYDRLVAGEPVESLGLPNLGLPRPVPIAPGQPTKAAPTTEPSPRKPERTAAP